MNQSNNNNRRRDSSPNGRAARSPSPGRSSTLNRPDPKFEGCWHCKGKGHSRRDCPDFKEILRKNGGKVPKEYKGAYERWKASTKKVAACIPVEEDDDDEFDETQQLWALACGLTDFDDMVCGECEIDPDDHFDHFDDCACCYPPLSAALERTVPMPKSSPVATSNVFAALQDDDDRDDEDEMLAAPKQMSQVCKLGRRNLRR